MRYTTEENPDVRKVAAGEIWVGVIPQPVPHIAIASRPDGNVPAAPVVVARLGQADAYAMGTELIRLSNTLAAPDN